MLLLLSGDVEVNPGPRAGSVYPCDYCELPVNWSHRAVCCDDCSMWYHKSCTSMNSEMYNMLNNNHDDESIYWPCYKCDHKNTSVWCSHRNVPVHVYNSFVLDTANSFAPLSGDTSSVVDPPDPVFLPQSHSSPKSNISHHHDSHNSVTPPISNPLEQSAASTPHPRSNKSINESSTSSNSLPASACATSSNPSGRGLINKKSNWRTLVLNANGIRSKHAELLHLVDYTNPDAILLTESKLDPSIANSEFMPQGYSVVRKDRTSGGGGVTVAVRSCYSAVEVDIETECELVWVSVSLRNDRKVHLASFYRPPPSASAEPLE